MAAPDSELAGYPEGYRDPPWDGSEAQFRDVVMPARAAAITTGLNQRFAGVLPEGMRFEWGPEEREGPDGQEQA